MKTIPKRFKDDPEWYQVEEIIKEFIDPLLDVNGLDVTLTPEELKIEILARKKTYEALQGFIRSRGIEKSEKLPEQKVNVFK